MTTAARPTFDPAQGGTGRGEKDLSSISRQYSSRDLPSHTKLKYRVPGQGTEDERKSKDYRRELEEKERIARHEREIESRPGVRDRESSHALAIADTSVQAQPPPTKKSKSDSTANLDADDPIDASSDEDEDRNQDSSDDEDDTAALMAELQRIKKERLAEQARKENEKRAEEERIRAENILSGNPLLNYQGPNPNGPAGSGGAGKGDMKVKRRWDEDVVFKNCARLDDNTKGKTFINDCLRSDFHRKFMEKYIK